MSLMNIVQPVTISKAVAKISSMFPTVEESHIRDLYKKWVSLLYFLHLTIGLVLSFVSTRLTATNTNRY